VKQRTKGGTTAPAADHVRYVMRTHELGAAAHIGYVTRTTHPLKEDLVDTGYGNLPKWAQDDPVTFFAASDKYERANGRTCRQIDASLPRGLSPAQQREIVETFTASQFGTQQAYVWGIHAPLATDGLPYPHVHIAWSERGDGRGITTPQEHFSRAWNPKDPYFAAYSFPERARNAWSDSVNVTLERAGSTDYVDPRSFAKQGLDIKPVHYISPAGVQKHDEKYTQRQTAADTPAWQASRAAAWEGRKQGIGLTPVMSQSETALRIGEASRARLMVGQEKRERTLARQHDRLHETVQTTQRLRREEQHYVAHPEQIRSTNHLAAVAKLVRSTQEGDDTGQVKRRRRTRQDDDQERGRTHAREW
jgi:hypothetical protein